MSDCVEKLQQFLSPRLSKIRGAAHEAIIGEWVRWWIDLKPERHLVFNPAPYAQNRSADILFVEEDPDEFYQPIGVGEIENDQKKWLEKLKSLQEYIDSRSDYPELKFVLLCTRVSEIRKKAFNNLVEQAKELSNRSDVAWILFRLNEKPWKEDYRPVIQGEDVWYYRFISTVGWIVIRKGEIVDEKSQISIED